MQTRRLLTIAVALACTACAGLRKEAGRTEPSQAAGELTRLYDAVYAKLLELEPESATRQGIHVRDAQLSDPSPAGQVEYYRVLAEFLRQYERLDEAAIGAAEQTNYELLGSWLRGQVEGEPFARYVFQLDPLHGFHISLPRLFGKMRYRNAGDYDTALARLAEVPRYYSRARLSLEEGIERGLVEAVPVVRKVLDQLEKQAAQQATEHPFWDVFREPNASLSEVDQKHVRSAAHELIDERVLPAIRELHDWVETTYLPAARSDVGVWALPEGLDMYAWRIREETSTDLDAEAIHAIGLEEVARIRGEMDGIREATEFDGDLRAFFEYLRTDPRFYFETPGELLAGYRDICKRADVRLPELFGLLPRTPYGVTPIPDYAAVSSTSAYYDGPSADGLRPGYFYVNTYDLPSRPKYEMEALALHEAVPGHHLQIALQNELDDLPPLRTRFFFFNGFVEGWGLYSELLGKEMGFYEDPYSDLGRLTFEAWRACRLVVDTGMHQKSWTRQQAIDFMADNTALSQLNIESEVDRYIAWPGQALGYKLGELKIRELRALAEKAIGEDFDVRAFHDLILAEGAIPLDLLERRVKAWIQRQSRAPLQP